MADGIPSNFSCRVMIPCLLIVMTAVGFGQGPATPEQMSGITALVTDSPGAVIANAEVTFKNKVTNEVMVERTAVDGCVQLKLPYGRYDVTVVSPGFKTTKIVDFFVETERSTAVRVLHIDPVIHDSYPGEEELVPTIVSDLPNLINVSLSAQSTEFIGNWQPDH